MLQPGHWWIFHGKPWFWLLPKFVYGRISGHFSAFFPTNSGTNVIASSHLKVAKANTFFRKSASSRSVLIKALLAFPFLEIDQVDFLTRSETTFILHQLRYIESSCLFMANTLWVFICCNHCSPKHLHINATSWEISKSPVGSETRCQLCQFQRPVPVMSWAT